MALKSEPYLIGTKFMIWSHGQEENELYGDTIFTIESYRHQWGRWEYRSDLPWISTAYEMILVEEK